MSSHPGFPCCRGSSQGFAVYDGGQCRFYRQVRKNLKYLQDGPHGQSYLRLPKCCHKVTSLSQLDVSHGANASFFSPYQFNTLPELFEIMSIGEYSIQDLERLIANVNDVPVFSSSSEEPPPVDDTTDDTPSPLTDTEKGIVFFSLSPAERLLILLGMKLRWRPSRLTGQPSHRILKPKKSSSGWELRSSKSIWPNSSSARRSLSNA